MSKKNSQLPFYLSLIVGITLGIIGVFIFKTLPNKDCNSWLGITGAMLSLLGIILTIKSSINLETYYSSIKYIKLDKRIKKIQETIPEITRKALSLSTKIRNCRGLPPTDLDNISNEIIEFCNELTNLFNDAAEYMNVYEKFLKIGKDEKVTSILTNWNSGIDTKCTNVLQYIHENLPKTVTTILDTNREKIDNSLKGIVF